MGIGNGCLFCPTVATVSTYFSKKRGLAIGMTACGSATGGLIFPAMARQLLPTAGFPWTIRAIGFIQAAGLVLANIGLRRRIPPRKAGALVEWAAFKELEYTFYAAGSFTVSLVFLDTLALDKTAFTSYARFHEAYMRQPPSASSVSTSHFTI